MSVHQLCWFIDRLGGLTTARTSPMIRPEGGRFLRSAATGILGIFATAWSSGAGAQVAQPVAPTVPVVDDYYGTRITDPYRWMEDRRDPRMIAWLKAEHAHARAVLAAIPGIDALAARIAAVNGASDQVSVPQPAGGRLFYIKRPAGAQTTDGGTARPAPSRPAGKPAATRFSDCCRARDCRPARSCGCADVE